MRLKVILASVADANFLNWNWICCMTWMCAQGLLANHFHSDV